MFCKKIRHYSMKQPHFNHKNFVSFKFSFRKNASDDKNDKYRAHVVQCASTYQYNTLVAYFPPKVLISDLKRFWSGLSSHLKDLWYSIYLSTGHCEIKYKLMMVNIWWFLKTVILCHFMWMVIQIYRPVGFGIDLILFKFLSFKHFLI